MNHCKTCKWWVYATGSHNKDTNWHTCDHPKMKQGYLDWDEVDPDGVLIEDDEGWGWIVGPEFGCIHHEVKP